MVSPLVPDQLMQASIDAGIDGIITDTHGVVIKVELLGLGAEDFLDPFRDQVRLFVFRYDTTSSVGACRSRSTVDIEHPIRVWIGENSPLLGLRLQRRVGVPMCHDTRRSHRDVGDGVEHGRGTLVVFPAAIGDMINPGAIWFTGIFQHKLIPLAWEIIESCRPVLILSTVEPPHNPPFPRDLGQRCEVLDGLSVVGETNSVGFWRDREAAVIRHALHHASISGGVVAVIQLAEQVATLHVARVLTASVAGGRAEAAPVGHTFFKLRFAVSHDALSR